MQANWETVDQAAAIFRARYKIPGTTPYSVALGLPENKLLVFSPGPGLEDLLPAGFDSTTKLLLLAPNIGHNLGIVPWQQHYPDARVFAPQGLQDRLRKKKRSIDGLESVETLAALLPGHVKLHVLPENKFHEVWLSVDSGNRTYWLICDAFLNFDYVDGNFIIKFLLGLYGIKPGLRLHKIFRMGLKDKPGFRNWALPLFDNDRQHVLLPCHREIYDAGDCGQRMVEMLNALK
ncbi:MAG: hypothetical protein O2948_03690 [Proteobacteria bacterium]|nr:hypothetical protein [Pseudomonadota bacterium]MDA0928553.1 hypothetical protein [Pseudomonadota bacterium]